MLKTVKCALCNTEFELDGLNDTYYFLGFNTQYYGEMLSDERDPHKEITFICNKCGKKLEEKKID